MIRERRQGKARDAGELALLRLGNLQLREAGRLDPKTLARGRALGARDALPPGSHTGWVAATSAVTNGSILPAIQVAD